MKTVCAIWLCIAGGITLYFGFHLSKNIYDFLTYRCAITGALIQWDVLCLKEENYVLKGSYEYTYEGKCFRGEHQFDKPIFTSPHSAAYIREKHQKRNWPVWINPLHPERSTLQRVFSIELIVKTMLGIGFCLYPFWLMAFLSRKGLKQRF